MDQIHQTLLDQIPGKAMLVRAHTRELVGSNSAAVESGASPGERCFESMSDEACRWCAVAKLWETGDPQHAVFEDRGCLFDGRWVRAGDELSLCVLSRAEERQIPDHARRGGEVRWRILVEESPDHIVTLDTDLRIEFASRPVVGLPLDEVIGTHLCSYAAPDGQARVQDALRTVLETGETADLESTYRTPDDNVLSFELHVVRRVVSGQATGLIVYARDCTERKKAEEAARRLRVEYEDLYENAADMFVSVDAATGKILKCNGTLATALGHTKEEIVGRSVLDMYHPDSGDLPAELLQSFSRTGEIPATDLVLRKKDGSPLDVSLKVTSVRDAAGNALRSRSSWRDISERKRAEADLRRAIVLQQAAIDRMPLAYIIWDAKGLITEWNLAAERIFGFSKEEMLGKPIDGPIVPEEVRHLVGEAIGAMMQGEPISYSAADNNVRKDGVLISCRWHNVPLRDENNEVFAVLSMAEDVSESLAAEAKLQESERRFRTLFERAGDALFLIAPDGRLVEVNQRACEGLGYAREELLRMSAEEIDPDMSDDALRSLRERLKLGGAVTVEATHHRKDGTTFPVEIRSGMIDGPGEPFLLALARDVTDRERLETELRQAQRMETVGQLAGGVAHDFNNLLTIICSCCDLMELDLPATASSRGDLGAIRDAANRAATLTAQLLAFSRRQVLRPEVVDLNAVIANLEGMLRRLIDENIDVIYVPGQGLGRVRVDVGQIEQVILNLAVNGRDAMPDGGTLTIETLNVVLDEAYCERHPESAPGPHVMLAVSDTGEGMDEETLLHAFDPFFTTKEVGRGTGMGLATVHGIVKQSGGNVWVYSEPGRGTTFKIYFPRLTAPAAVAERNAPTAERPKGDETILVVEDNSMVRAVAVRILRLCGYTVLEASGGEEAAFVSEQHPGEISLLLADVVLPGGSGRQVSERLIERRPRMKTLYVSGYTDNAIVHHGVLDGGVPFLEKPFTLTTLSRAVRAVLDT